MTTDPAKADFVIFTGGSDVSPSLYGERTLPGTYVDEARDEEDKAMYDYCINNGIPMLGVCRGAQFLWVMRGGKLYQDINNHNDGEHMINVFEEKTIYRASSVHHQAVRPEGLGDFRLIATTAVSNRRQTQDFVTLTPSTDFEIWAHPKAAILSIQGHPEYEGYPEYSALCLRLIDKHMYDNPATKYIDGRLRVDPGIAAGMKK